MVKTAIKPVAPEARLRAFIGKFDPRNQKLMGSVRAAVRKLFPTANELAYEYNHAVVISYSPSERGIEGIVSLSLLAEGVRLYFRDVFDHAIRVKEASDTMSEMVTAAMSVNLAMVSVGQNEVVKKLAGWAALLAAPTLITSWYGMNFKNMPELGGKYSYGVLILVVAVACVGLYRLLKRAKWL